ncbi:MAG: hypothetical protein AB7W37_16910 [Syntrophobacteraceae bacterium]
MKKLFAAICLAMSVCAFTPAAHASVATFESLAHNDDLTVEAGATYEEAGLLFTNTATVDSSGFEPTFSTMGALAYGYSGSTALINDNYAGETMLTTTSRAVFSMNSISLSELYADDEDPFSFDVVFTGLLSDGSTVTATFTVDGLTGAQTFAFGSEFSSLISLSWVDTNGIQFDNVDASPVPIPGAIWLLGSSLAGLASLRRKLQG